jgi:hypothetical protein
VALTTVAPASAKARLNLLFLTGYDVVRITVTATKVFPASELELANNIGTASYNFMLLLEKPFLPFYPHVMPNEMPTLIGRSSMQTAKG